LAPMRSTVAGLPPAQRARRTNDPLAGIRTNTARGRRIADLVRAYLLALGNPTEIERQAEVIAAAELQVLAEEARSLALKQVGHADLDQVIRLQGAADRAVRKLGLPDRKREPEGPTLADILADRYGTEQGEDAPEAEAGIRGRGRGNAPQRALYGHRRAILRRRGIAVSAMSTATEGLDMFLADRRLAIGALLADMHAADLVRACSGHVSEAEVAVAIERHAILRLSERSEAST
jgi:hypothetical protein